MLLEVVAVSNTTDTIYGKMQLSSCDADLISRILRSHGEWGYIETELLSKVISTDTVVYDVGAYIGTFSLGISKYWPSRVVSVEANPASYELLTINVLNNCQIPCELVNAAVGLNAGKAVAIGGDADNLGSISFRELDAAHDDGSVVVELLALRQLRRTYGDYGLLKLDLEGGEYDALRGDAVWIKENKPIVWAECNEAPSVRQLLQFYLWAELNPYYVAFPAIRLDNFKQCLENPYPLAYEAALIGGKKEVVEQFVEVVGQNEVICKKVSTFNELKQVMWLTPRWGRKEWTELSRIELLGLLGHEVLSLDYNHFLQPDGD